MSMNELVEKSELEGHLDELQPAVMPGRPLDEWPRALRLSWE